MKTLHKPCYTRNMKVIISNTSHDAYHRMLNELKRRLPDGGEHFVIVPDRFTASAERGVIETLGLSASFNVSVTSFTRLAERTIGGRIKKCLTPQGSVMMLAKVIEEKRDELKYYGKATRLAGFADEFYAALTAIRNSGIGSADMRAAAEHAPAAFADKVHDLCLVYEGYLAALAGRHSDSSTRLEAFAQYLSECPPQAAHYYVVDFYDFKSPELAILGGLAKCAASLTVGLVGGFSNPNRRIYCDGVVKRLTDCCDGVEIETASERLNPVADVISRRLFSYEPPAKRVENNGKVRIIGARNVSEEILALMTHIKTRVSEGARYKDFEVVLADPDCYKPELKSAFLRFGIPFFIDTRELLAEQTKVRYVLSAIAVVRSRYARAEVLELIKNPLFVHGIEGGENSVFRFENYVLRYNVDYGRFTQPFALGGDEERAVAESVRGKLVKVTELFAFAGDIPSEEFVTRTRAFLGAADEAWKQHTAKLTEMSLYYAKCADQVDEKTDAVLDEIAEALCASGDIAYFENVFKSMLRTVKIALVPTYLDAVYVGTTENRYLGGGDVWFLGANVGKFPAGKGGGTVLSPKDEETFAALGVEINPAQRQRIFSELMSVTEIMKKPKGTLVISYPESDLRTELRPSTVITELRGMLSENGEPLGVETFTTDNLPELRGEERNRMVRALYSTPQACLHGILGGLRRKRNGELSSAARKFVNAEGEKILKRVYERDELPDFLSSEAAHAAAGEGVIRTSASRLETYFSCPYKHFLNYTLKLKEREEAGFVRTDNGTILHGVLQEFFKAVRAGRVTDGNLAQIVDRAFDATVRKIERIDVLRDEPVVKRALDRLREESERMCAELFRVSRRSRFAPRYIEEHIGGTEIPSLSFDVDGRRVELTGYIDRVDVLDDKFVIIDYKTYKGAELALKDVYSGERIQLYIYLRAIEKGKGWRPVGAFYLPISNDYADENERRYRYSGQYTSDDDEANEIDNRFSTDPDGCVLPVQGTRGRKILRLAPEGFDLVSGYVERLVRRGAGEIMRGDIAPCPLSAKQCDDCDFGTVCAFKGRNVREVPGRISMEDFAVDATETQRTKSAQSED